jgi:hypothetical protein
MFRISLALLLLSVCAQVAMRSGALALLLHFHLLNREKLLDAARLAHKRQWKMYCIVISARGGM